MITRTYLKTQKRTSVALTGQDWRFKRKSRIARSLEFGKEGWKTKERDVFTTTTGQDYRDEQVKAEFNNLVKAWTSAIKFYSLEKQQIGHPAFIRIVALPARSEKVIPLIFEEFSKRPFVAWLTALEAIFGENVASEAQSFREAVEKWLEWGKKKSYLKE